MPFCSSLPKSGLMLDGILYGLNNLELNIDEAEFSSSESTAALLNEMTTTDGFALDAENKFSRDANATISNGDALTATSGHTHFLRKRSLGVHFAEDEILPTLVASEARQGWQRRGGTKKGIQKSLSTVIMEKAGRKDKQKWDKGQLSPEFAEAFMGFPTSWTDIG